MATLTALAVALALALACALSGQCLGFNLDVKFPLAFLSTDHDDYSFGTSVLLQAGFDGQSRPWIQIGAPAPRSSNQTKMPGRVYRCPIGGKCKQVKFATIPGDKNFDDFVGGTMASQSPDEPSTVLVCGSRWHDKSPTSGTYLFTGICNWMEPAVRADSTPSNDWLTPLLNLDRRVETVHGINVFDWALGQAGFSAHFPWRHRQAVVLGAPGVSNWRGTLLFCQPDQYSSRPLERRSIALDSAALTLNGPKCTVAKPKNEEFDYLGYQVTSGRFFRDDEMLVAASAPRAGSSKMHLYGMVRLYALPLYAELWPVTTLNGDEIGGYFGASLAVGDFNADGRDDLAVGAPLSIGASFAGASRLADDGRVHQFLGSNSVRSLLRVEGPGGKLQGKAAGGRFGHAISCPGDLDRDGYADLVVGAPHEDDGRGTIYVFNGGPNGLSTTPSQRIMARDIDSLGKGFGISLSPAADIDGNMYSDLAVGTYGAAVVLRAHPVVVLRTTLSALNVQFGRIPQSAATVSVRACVSFTGGGLPKVINVVRSVDVSKGQHLAQLIDAAGQQVKTLITNIQLSNDNPCSNIDIQIKNGSKYQDTIELQASARLDTKEINSTPRRSVNGESLSGDQFCKWCPVSRRTTEPFILRLEFENECENQTCVADLRLRCHFLRDQQETNTHVVGSRKQLFLVVGAENRGESAYATRLVVTMPQSAALANVPSSCEFDETNAELTCDLRDLTPERNSSSVSVGLDMSGVLNASVGALVFPVKALTRSKQQVEDNRESFTLNLMSDAKFAIFGKPTGRASYRYDGGNASTQQVNFAHEFAVEKLGESPIDEAVLRVRFPSARRSTNADGDLVTYLFAYQPEVMQDGQPLGCTASEPYLNETSASEGLDSDVHRSKRAAVPFDGDLVTAGDAALHLPANETLFLDCDTGGGGGVVCAQVACTTRPFREASTVNMAVRMRIDVSMLGDLLGHKSIVSLTTSGDVLWGGDKEHSHANATTLFIGAAEVKEVASWIIALSVGGGLLLFSFLVMGLIKAGFFQRKQKMEMEAIIEQEAEIEAINRRSQMSPDSGSDADF